MTEGIYLPATQLRDFVAESFKIEGLTPTKGDIEVTEKFLMIGPEQPLITDLRALALVYTRGEGLLRDAPGMNVTVGNHRPPPGHPRMYEWLGEVLAHYGDPWKQHVAFEALHPFLDGNGRTGRALWAWHMIRKQRGLPLGFLQSFYYQTLERVHL